MRRTSGFTLIELMVVVSIIGLLGSMAAPSLQGALARARRAEIYTVKNGINHAMRDSFMRNNFNWPEATGIGVSWPLNPWVDVSTLDPTPGQCNPGPPQKWDSTSAFQSQWKWIDYEPEGLLRAHYGVGYIPVSGGSWTPTQRIWSMSDLDNNGTCVGKYEIYDQQQNGTWALTFEATYTSAGTTVGEDEW